MNVIEGQVICGAQAASCVCALEPHVPDTPHECYDKDCGGSWYGGDIDSPDSEVVKFPQIL